MLEQDVDGLIGWWLCSLHGKQGIAPGNRLQQIKRRSDEQTPPEASSQSGEVFTFEDVDYDVPRTQEAGVDYAVPRGVTSPDYDVPNVSRPDGGENLGEVYDLPENSMLRSEINAKQNGVENALDNYDQSAEVYDVPTSLLDDSFCQEIYDIPSKEKGDVESTDSNHNVESSICQMSPVQCQGSDHGESKQLSGVPGGPEVTPEIYDVLSASGDKDIKKDLFETTPTSTSVTTDILQENRSSAELHKAKMPVDVVSAELTVKRQSSSSTDSTKTDDDDYVDYQDIYGDGKEKDVSLYDVPVQVGHMFSTLTLLILAQSNALGSF